MSKYVVILCMAVLLCVGIVPGLSPAMGQEKSVVNLWWAIGEGEPYYPMNKEFVDEFNKTHPDIKVIAQSMSWGDIRDKAVVAGLAGNPPEMVESIPEWITDYYNLGLLLDVKPWIDEYPEKEMIYPVCWEALTYDGQIVGIPEYFGIRALLYHEEMFKNAGIINPPLSWIELQQVGKKLTKGSVYGFGFCGTSVRSPQEMIVYLWQNDTNIAQQMPDGKFKNSWIEDKDKLKAAAEALQFYYDNVYTYGISPRATVSWGYTEMDSNFAAGNTAMCVNGPWMQSYEQQYPEAMADVQITTIPYGKNPATFLEVLSYVIFKDSKNPEAAVTFGKEILNYKFQTEANRGQPIRKDIPVTGQKWIEPFVKLVPHGRFIPHISWGRMEKIMIDGLQSVLLKQKNPEETALWMSEEVNKALADMGELSSY